MAGQVARQHWAASDRSGWAGNQRYRRRSPGSVRACSGQQCAHAQDTALRTPDSVARRFADSGTGRRQSGGWGKWSGKNTYATTLINRHFRESGLVPDRKQSLYSLRHWFQDQLTKRDVVDRAQAQLMGHKFHRPKYGYGKDMFELRTIVAAFAIE